MISVLILTLNEEQNLPACLESVAWCDDIVVYDSFSTDRTVEIAKVARARVVQRVFDNFASQRNHALDEVAYKYPWVFHLDADERFTPALLEECQEAVRADECSGYLVPSKMMFMGRWLRFSGMYPSYQTRLLKRGEVRFIQKGHGQREGEAQRGIGRLKEPYLHYSFNKGITDWFAKHNRYSTQEALDSLMSQRHGKLDPWGWVSREPVRRRRALKELAAYLPCRPLLRFLYMYCLRLGVLDGMPGYHYCRLQATYEYMIALKMKEQLRRERGLPL
jgi:glycosyltransferase involved in cell wall biosynthesis